MPHSSSISNSSDTEEFSEAWYRVLLNTIIRRDIDTDSKRLKILPMGSRVRVQQVCDRRVRIDWPLEGWCSMKSNHGDLILELMNDIDEDLSSPRADKISQATLLRQKIELVKEKQRQAMKQRNRALTIPEVKILADECQRLKKTIRRKLRKPLSPVSMHARLIHTQSCLSKTQLENAEKAEQIAQLHRAKKRLAEICNKNNVSNPEELGSRIRAMERNVKESTGKIDEYRKIADRYQSELNTIRGKMADLLASNTDLLASNTTIVGGYEIHVGDVVMMKKGMGIVIIKYIGDVHWDSDEIYVGVELSAPIGINSIVDGKKYFDVPDKFAQFYKIQDIAKKISPSCLLKELQKQMQENQRILSSTE